MTRNSLNARERLLEVIRILETYTDEDEMLSIHDIHSRFPEYLQVGIGAVRDDVNALEDSIVFPVTAVRFCYMELIRQLLRQSSAKAIHDKRVVPFHKELMKFFLGRNGIIGLVIYASNTFEVLTRTLKVLFTFQINSNTVIHSIVAACFHWYDGYRHNCQARSL